nr:magnesium and cobalt transport protein CorA [Jatrophihabitans sp. GAS493]
MTNRARRHIPRPASLRPAVLRPGPRHAPVPWIPEVERSTAIVDCAVYVGGVRHEPSHDDRGRPNWREAHDGVVASGEGFVWIGLHEPSDAQLAGLAEHFNLHPLAVEDAVSAHQRPKLESYDDEMLFAVVKTVHYDESAVSSTDSSTTVEVVDTGEVMVFLGVDYVITVRHGEHGGLHALRKRLEKEQTLLAEGPSAVLHGILDHVVDDYLAVAEALQTDIDEMEVAVFGGAARSLDTNRMYILKREVLALQRSAAPLTVPLRSLGETEMPLIAEEIREYFRDVNDHLGQVIDQVTAFDDLLNTLVSAHLAQVSVIQNEDMRKISAWVAIAAVPTMVAGIYGMNFDHMPELHWRFGYPLVVGIVVGVCLWLHHSFKRAGWL